MLRPYDLLEYFASYNQDKYNQRKHKKDTTWHN